MSLVEEHRQQLGTAPLCQALKVPRASFYRQQSPKADTAGIATRKPPEHALSEAERHTVLATLHEPRFVDLAPPQVYARLLEEGRYLCSIRTMYRLLAAHDEVRERRAVASRVVYTKPELLATRPNEVWSWDITKLKGPAKWTYYYLYVILDIFSRYVVGWMIAPQESATLAKHLIAESCRKQQIAEDQLTLHADRGSSMKSKLVAELLADLGVTKTHSRPQVSNDNPYSESQFKTMKYRPQFPERFECIQGARAFGGQFFPGTTMSITTPPWPSIRPPTSTTDASNRFANCDKRPWTPPISGIPTASYVSHRRRHHRLRPSGSTHPETRRTKP